MTFTEIDNAFKRLLDEAQAPACEPQERMDYLNQMALVWALNHNPEISEKARIDLDPLTKIQNLGAVTTVTKSALSNAFLKLLALRGKWVNCGNRYVPIKPSTFDTIGEEQRNPFQQPSDCFPKYKLASGVYTVLSDTTPTDVEIVYLKKPATINPISAGSTVCEFPDHACMEIVELALQRYLEVIESQRLQTQANFIQPLQ